VLKAAEELLGQCVQIVEAVDDAAYSRPSAVLRGGSIGKHLRHTLDHYAAIVAHAVGGEPIDYDHRARGVSVETDRVAARSHIAMLRTGVAGLRGAASEPVTIRVMVSGDGAEALLESTVAREVAFATHHGVHHVAMMKAIAGEMGVEFGDEVGKAPSTIQYERSAASA
jgi:uncharacterized damage-inducible protein DinB